jgi:ATP-dependent Clp protease adaptor protein ClpS
MSGPPDSHHDDDVVLDQAPTSKKARRYLVVFHNDHYTTKWFVVHVLEQFFHMNETTATAFMMAVHEHGKGVAGVYTRDIAETKATQIMDYAREMQMPLMVTAEPDEEGDDD